MTRSQQKRKRTEVPPALSPNRERSIVLDAPPTKKARLRQPEIVIGIDWGTTWTGVAWTLVTEKAQNTNEEAKINVIQQWPAGSRTSDKAPTEFVYTEDGSWETLKWGFQAQAPDLSPRVIRWTKLLLDPDYTNLVPEAQEASKKIPHNKAVTELVADYLSALRAHITETLTAVYGPTFLKRSKLKYILTVPAIWSEKAKETHLEAAGKAGYGSKEELDLISEPQAASIAAFRSLGHGPLRRYDCFTVVDCGGGTVDLISYKVMNFRPHIEFREITGGQGGGCGSIFINKAFETYMIKRFGSKNYESMPPKSKARMMGDFELAKQSFSDDEHEEKFYVTAIGLPRKYKGAIGVDGDGYLTLTRDDMRNIFDPTIDSIVALISAQIKSAAVASQRVKSGFGGSPYLRRRVQEWVDKEKYTIEVAQPPDAVTYCQHLETEEFVDPGDLKITDTLYAYNGDDTPAKPSDYGVRPLCDLETDLNSIPKEKWKVRNKTDGTSYYMIEFDFVMEVEGEKLLFGLEIDGVKYSGVSATFH
ncbi:hypothetical protein TWF970_005366 [Orbilia oligospora]|uniref:Uncharacterized protein n=1 Tax=Orbilia oligospora TaxID=2813651 RepID=A0A7C8VXD6_ORBOL|nr:hypothetical protein TWF970_005366 [Orbilia oligospora]